MRCVRALEMVRCQAEHEAVGRTRHTFDGRMQGSQLLRVRRRFERRGAHMRIEQPPRSTEKPVHPIDAASAPDLRLAQRPHEHLIEPQRVGSCVACSVSSQHFLYALDFDAPYAFTTSSGLMTLPRLLLILCARAATRTAWLSFNAYLRGVAKHTRVTRVSSAPMVRRRFERTRHPSLQRRRP
jgi:hypothetical protein